MIELTEAEMDEQQDLLVAIMGALEDLPWAAQKTAMQTVINVLRRDFVQKFEVGVTDEEMAG